MTHLLLWGNAYAQIIRNGKNEVVALYPLMPNKMTVDRDTNGHLYYSYNRGNDEAIRDKQSTVILRPADILHIPGLGFDGLVVIHPLLWQRTPSAWRLPARNTVLSSLQTERLPAVSWNTQAL